jgi:hypothetical protein
MRFAALGWTGEGARPHTNLANEARLTPRGTF